MVVANENWKHKSGKGKRGRRETQSGEGKVIVVRRGREVAKCEKGKEYASLVLEGKKSEVLKGCSEVGTNARK